MSPRDSAALRALLNLRGPDGWTRPRARGQLLDAAGFGASDAGWRMWRRAVAALVHAGYVEVEARQSGWTGRPSPYRVLEAGMAALGRVASDPTDPTSDPTPTPLLETSYSSLALGLRAKEEHLRGGSPTRPDPTQRPDPDPTQRPDPTAAALLELAAAVRALAEALTLRTTAAPVAREQERSVPAPQKPAATTTKPKAERPPLFQRDRRGWTGHDCERPCGSHGTMRAYHNAADDSWFGRCATCGRRYDPAVERRNATPPDRPAQPAARPPSSPGSVGASVGALLQSLSGGLSRLPSALEQAG